MDNLTVTDDIQNDDGQILDTAEESNGRTIEKKAEEDAVIEEDREEEKPTLTPQGNETS